MEYKFLLLVSVLIILFYLKKSSIIQENQYSKIFYHGKNVKKIFKVEPKVSIVEQVKINNNSDLSPKILKYGKNFIIMECADITLRDMFYYFNLDRNKIEKLIKLFRKFN